MPLTGKDRAALRAEAHHLTPLVHVGQYGLSPTVIQSLDDALRTHELVKVQLGRNADVAAKDAAASIISFRLIPSPCRADEEDSRVPFRAISMPFLLRHF